MTVLMTNKIWWGLAAMLVLYVVVVLTFDNISITYIMRTLQVSFSFGALAAYSKAALGALTTRYPTRYQVAAFAIVLLFFSIAINGFWLLLWRLSDHPYWFVNNDAYSFFVYLAAIAVGILIATPGAVQGTVLTENRIIIALAVALSAIMIILAMIMKPDLTNFIQRLEPYLSSD